MKAYESLIAKDPEKKPPPRIDLKFEEMVLRCGIGCLINDIDMSDNDYIRLHLAFSRLRKQQ